MQEKQSQTESEVEAPPRIRSVRTSGYMDLLGDLPHGVRHLASRLYTNVFTVDPYHQMLRGRSAYDSRRKIHVWRVEVGNHRALAAVESVGDSKTFVWYWIGSHADYDKRIGSKKKKAEQGTSDERKTD